MNFIIPRDLLTWIDANRGELSRQSFIIRCLFKFKEMSQMTKF